MTYAFLLQHIFPDTRSRSFLNSETIISTVSSALLYQHAHLPFTEIIFEPHFPIHNLCIQPSHHLIHMQVTKSRWHNTPLPQINVHLEYIIFSTVLSYTSFTIPRSNRNTPSRWTMHIDRTSKNVPETLQIWADNELGKEIITFIGVSPRNFTKALKKEKSNIQLEHNCSGS